MRSDCHANALWLPCSTSLALWHCGQVAHLALKSSCTFSTWVWDWVGLLLSPLVTYGVRSGIAATTISRLYRKRHCVIQMVVWILRKNTMKRNSALYECFTGGCVINYIIMCLDILFIHTSPLGTSWECLILWPVEVMLLTQSIPIWPQCTHPSSEVKVEIVPKYFLDHGSEFIVLKWPSQSSDVS